jgi:hypothetical protein
MPSVGSDDVEEEKEISEDEKNLTDPIILNIQPNISRFTSIEKIIAADDQLINLEVLKSQLTDMGVQEKCTFCVNG